ncbi:hypothetical protein SNE40_003253 [Patella caerulea]|uniref:HTH CENPB-type domain-containing protein n=1 Tax=Patella caerulea TaxID=87958 RepID=A0AAN8KDV5_PATCE
MDEVNDGQHFNTTKFMNYLVKNLQVLCHGHVPFNQNLEVIGHIYIKVDCSAKFNRFLNEVVSKTDSCETLFTSNSFQAQSQTENNNRTVINNLKTNVDEHFQDNPSDTECSSTKKNISMPVLLTEETAGDHSVSQKETTCILKENNENTSKKSNAEINLNLESSKTCNSSPSRITCRSLSDNGNVCNSSSFALTNETTQISTLPAEANISNPTQYGNIWNSLSIVNSSPSIQNDNKDSWNLSMAAKQDFASSSDSSSSSKESMSRSIEGVQYTPPRTKENVRTNSSAMKSSSLYDEFSPKIINIRSNDQTSDKDTANSITDLQTTGTLAKNYKLWNFVIKNGALLETHLSPLNTLTNSTSSVSNSPSTVNSCNVSSSGSNRLSSADEHLHTSTTPTKEIIPDVEDIKIDNANKWNVVTSSDLEQVSPKIDDISSDANSLNIPDNLDKGNTPVLNVIEHSVSRLAYRGEEDPNTISHSPVPLNTTGSESLRYLRSSHKQTVASRNIMKSPGRTGIINDKNSPVTRENLWCSVKVEPGKSHNNNATVVKFAKSEDAILQCKKEFKTETIQTSDSANDDILTCNTDDINEQTLCDSNIDALRDIEEQILSDSTNLQHNTETPLGAEEYALSDSISLRHNIETPPEAGEHTLSDSINLLHNIEKSPEAEKRLSDSTNLHNIETLHEVEASSNILLENINKLDRISKELAIRNIDDGSVNTEEGEAGCSSDLSFIHDDDSVDDPCYRATKSSDEYCDSDDSQINRLTRKRKRLSKPTGGKAPSQNKKIKARNRMSASNRKVIAESSTIGLPTNESATESIKDGAVIPTGTCAKISVSGNSVKSVPKKNSTQTKRKKKIAFHETPDTDTRLFAPINNGHRASYCASDKLKIILYADFHGNRAAGRKYGIAESNVRRWKQGREELLAMGPNKLCNRRCPPYYPTIEKQLAEWVQGEQESGVYPSISEICSQALVIAEGQNCGRGPFKASYSWATRFLDRHKLRKNIRRYKKLSQDSANDGGEEDLGNSDDDLFYGGEDLEASMKEIMEMLNDDDEDVEFDGFTEKDLS